MNIDMRNVSPEMEKAINEIMIRYNYQAATKAIIRAVLDYEGLRNRIDKISKDNDDLRNELYEEKQKTKKTVKYLKFFRDLIKKDT